MNAVENSLRGYGPITSTFTRHTFGRRRLRETLRARRPGTPGQVRYVGVSTIRRGGWSSVVDPAPRNLVRYESLQPL